jgi:hypothetical protein
MDAQRRITGIFMSVHDHRGPALSDNYKAQLKAHPRVLLPAHADPELPAIAPPFMLSVPMGRVVKAVPVASNEEHCDNCGAPLQGSFCHHCGQPTRHFMRFFPAVVRDIAADSIGIDGRFWRTLKALMFRPGRLTIDYLYGRRVHYSPPFRLYLFSSLVAFLIITSMVDTALESDGELVQAANAIREEERAQRATEGEADGTLNDAIAEAAGQAVAGSETPMADASSSSEVAAPPVPESSPTLAQTDEQRPTPEKESVVEIEPAEDEASPTVPTPPDPATMQEQMKAALVGVDGSFEERKAALDNMEALLEQWGVNDDQRFSFGENSDGTEKWYDADDLQAWDLKQQLETPEDVQRFQDAMQAMALAKAVENLNGKEEEDNDFELHFFGDKAWHVTDNPLTFSFLTDGMNERLNQEIHEFQMRAPDIRKDPRIIVDPILEVLPQTMFLLLPAFALLLKIFYCFSRRYYMEHLLFALHNHAFVYAMIALGSLLEWVNGVLSGWGTGPLWYEIASGVEWLWLFVYLFLAQKRVYGQGWILTSIKFVLLGILYSILLSFVAVIASLVGIILI